MLIYPVLPSKCSENGWSLAEILCSEQARFAQSFFDKSVFLNMW